jgi:hypothetical protein
VSDEREPYSRDVSEFYAADPWLERASDLLEEADPGPTPFLVEELLVDRALAAIQGQPKTWKTWLELELACAIVTGRPAFGRFEVPDPGPVVLVLEESGRAALHRRLGSLARGNAIGAEELAELHFAANRRVRLDDLEWQKRLLAAVSEFRPRAVFLDPLARLKSAVRKENAQEEMAVLLDFMRLLRDEGDCTVAFVHHTGHEGTHLRGSSDLESYWESKVALKRDGDEAEFTSEHREAEAGRTHRFRQAWDAETVSVRLRLLDDERQEEIDGEISVFLETHPDASANEVFKALGGNRSEVLEAVRRVRGEVVPSDLVPPGTTPPGRLAGGTSGGGSPPVGGSPGGTTELQVVPAELVPPSQDEGFDLDENEIERLAELAREASE